MAVVIDTVITTAKHLLVNKLQEVMSALGLWNSHSPSFGASGSMTWTSVTGFFYYIRVGRLCIGLVRFRGTIGGTPSHTLTVTLPPDAQGDGNEHSGGCSLTSSGFLGGTYFLSGTDVSFRLYDGSNLTAGSSRGPAGVIIWRSSLT